MGFGVCLKKTRLRNDPQGKVMRIELFRGLHPSVSPFLTYDCVFKNKREIAPKFRQFAYGSFETSQVSNVKPLNGQKTKVESTPYRVPIREIVRQFYEEGKGPLVVQIQEKEKNYHQCTFAQMIKLEEMFEGKGVDERNIEVRVEELEKQIKSYWE